MATDAPEFARLQLGISRPGAIPDEALDVFFDSTWINLGDPPSPSTPKAAGPPPRLHSAKQTLQRALRSMSASYDERCRSRELARAARRERIDALDRSPHFRPFWWTVDAQLPFPAASFTFVFSEHFFEHLWPDEAYALFRECFRILRPNGVLRVSVPDADLRVYAEPEPFAFDAATLVRSTRGWLHPDVHKTRWNVYLLTLLLDHAGFGVRPIVYCDKHGSHLQQWPHKDDPAYPPNADWDVIGSNAYLIRKSDSLIVDAMKMPPGQATHIANPDQPRL